jgi:hypothetical protein
MQFKVYDVFILSVSLYAPGPQRKYPLPCQSDVLIPYSPGPQRKYPLPCQSDVLIPYSPGQRRKYPLPCQSDVLIPYSPGPRQKYPLPCPSDVLIPYSPGARQKPIPSHRPFTAIHPLTLPPPLLFVFHPAWRCVPFEPALSTYCVHAPLGHCPRSCHCLCRCPRCAWMWLS